MIQTVDVDAALWRERRNVEFFAGEPLHFNILNRQPGAEIVLTIAADHQTTPVLEVAGSDEIALSGDALLAIPEGKTFVLNVWSRASGGLTLLVEGKIHSLGSVAPSAPPAPDPLALTGAPATTAIVGVPYSFLPAVSGGVAPYQFDLASGVLPAGLALDAGTGTISGTPAAVETQAGIVMRVTDAAGNNTVLGAFDITVSAALSITGTPPTNATVGQPLSFTPTAAGGTPPYSFSLAAGTLPAALSLDAATGAISGTPTAAETQTGIVLRVADADGSTADLAPFDLVVSMPALQAPANLFTPSQSTFDTTAHVDLRNNWQLSAGRLACLNASANDVRLSLDAPLVAGNAHFGLYDADIPAATLKFQLGGAGSVSGRSINEAWQAFEYFPSSEVAAAYLRAQIKPSSGFTGSIDDVQLFDLSAVDPSLVACDVIIVGGDSNASNATSEKFGVDITSAARETPFDPRIWYMPCLRTSGVYGNTDSVRHVPQPCIEPVASQEAVRMSPVHAVAGQIVGWSAARGRPLLVMALGDSGSGLRNSEDWLKGSTVTNTGARMWNEMVAMKAALDAMGPAHQIVGAVWSMGANDQFGGDYEVNHGPVYSQFFADVRTDIADVPMVLWNLGTHLDSAGDGRSEAMRQFLRRFDQASGDPRSMDRFKVVEIAPGNEIDPLDAANPHYNAHGIQQNGRDAGVALLSLL